MAVAGYDAPERNAARFEAAVLRTFSLAAGNCAHGGSSITPCEPCPSPVPKRPRLHAITLLMFCPRPIVVGFGHFWRRHSDGG